MYRCRQLPGDTSHAYICMLIQGGGSHSPPSTPPLPRHPAPSPDHSAEIKQCIISWRSQNKYKLQYHLDGEDLEDDDEDKCVCVCARLGYPPPDRQAGRRDPASNHTRATMAPPRQHHRERERCGERGGGQVNSTYMYSGMILSHNLLYMI